MKMRNLFRKNRVQAVLGDLWPTEDALLKSQQQHATQVNDSLLLVDGKIVIPDDKELIGRLIICAHYANGHRGYTTLARLLRDRYAFDIPFVKLLEYVKEYHRECLHCRPRNRVMRRVLGHTEHSAKRFSMIHMDFLYIGPSTVGYSYVLVLIDDYSSLVQLFPVVDCNAHETVMGLLDFHSQHGFHVDTIFVSDNASYFVSDVLARFCKWKSIKQRFSLAYSPFTNGTAERPNQEILAVFRSLLSQHRISFSQWPQLIGVVESVLNHLPRTRLQNRTPIGISHNIVETDILQGLEFTASINQKTLTFDHSVAAKEFNSLAVHFDAWHKERAATRTQFNSKLDARFFNKFIDFGVGDWVLVAVEQSRKKSKVQFSWQGPAQIIAMDSVHYASVKYVGSEKVLTLHTCMLAFYSDSLLHQRSEIEEQFLYDSKRFAVSDILGLMTDPVTNEVLVKVRWKGLGDQAISVEPLEALRQSISVLLVQYLRSKPDDALAIRALNIIREGGDVGVEDAAQTRRRIRRKKKRPK